MKLITTIAFLMTLLMSTVVFSAETSTECPMMREMNERSNPKASLKTKEAKIKTSNSGAVSM